MKSVLTQIYLGKAPFALWQVKQQEREGVLHLGSWQKVTC